MDSAEFDPNSLFWSIIAAIAPIVVGGVSSHFKLFLAPPAEFHEKARREKQNLIERLANLHNLVLDHARRALPDEQLRSESTKGPDLIGDYARETFRQFTILTRLEFVLRVVRYVYLWLFVSTALGFFGVLIAVLLEPARIWIFWCAIGAVTLQIGSVLILHQFRQRLEVDVDIF